MSLVLTENLATRSPKCSHVLIPLWIFLPFWIFATSAVAADLSITVTNLRSSEGDVHIAVYNDANGFPDSDGMIRDVQMPISGTSVTTTFSDLSPGRYALATFHDENGNHEFDQGWLGIPLEDYAFSNDAMVFLGPPTFDEAAIDLPATGTRHSISLGN